MFGFFQVVGEDVVFFHGVVIEIEELVVDDGVALVEFPVAFEDGAAHVVGNFHAVVGEVPVEGVAVELASAFEKWSEIEAFELVN